MLLLFIFIEVVLFIMVLFFFMMYLISFGSSSYDKGESSSYECGFDSKMSARLPFSLQFFLLGIIFLVFDIEIALILPLPSLSCTMPLSCFLMPIFIFVIIVMGGTIHEWNEGSLKWEY